MKLACLLAKKQPIVPFCPNSRVQRYVYLAAPFSSSVCSWLQPRARDGVFLVSDVQIEFIPEVLILCLTYTEWGLHLVFENAI